MSKNIVFIDSRVAGYETLIASLSADSEWYLLDAAQDGLEQMQRVLDGRTGLDAIHVVSHGSPGSLYLGSTVLDSNNLAAYGAQLGAMGSSLTATGDLLLYGCNVAQGDVGLQFISTLAQATGADVAASENLTGQAILSGDWVLEHAIGIVDSVTILGTEFVGLLEVPTVGFKKNNTSVVEGNSGVTKFNFLVELSAPSASLVTVNYNTNKLSGYVSATQFEDYTPITSQVTFAPGETSKTISVDVVGDTNYEASEYFYLELTSATGAEIVKDGAEGYRNSWIQATIKSDDTSEMPVVLGGFKSEVQHPGFQ